MRPGAGPSSAGTARRCCGDIAWRMARRGRAFTSSRSSMSSARSGAPITGIAGERRNWFSIANSCFSQPLRSAVTVADMRHNQDGVSENLSDSYQAATDACERPEGLQVTEAAQNVYCKPAASTDRRTNLAERRCTMQRRRGQMMQLHPCWPVGRSEFRGFLWHDAAATGLPQWASGRRPACSSMLGPMCRRPTGRVQRRCTNALAGDAGTANLLLDAADDPAVRDRRGLSAADVAAARHNEPRVGVIEMKPLRLFPLFLLLMLAGGGCARARGRSAADGCFAFHLAAQRRAVCSQ